MGTSVEGDGRIELIELLRCAQDPANSLAERALEQLLTRLHKPVRQFIERRVGACRDAEDVVADITQETLVHIAMHFGACTAADDRMLVAWVLTAARRVLIDTWRSPSSGLAARYVSTSLDSEVALRLSGTGVNGRIESCPARETILRLGVEAYNAASEETGELIWHRLIQGDEWSELGARFRTTGPGAKRRFQRAQQKLRRKLGELIAALPDGQRHAVQALVERYEQPDEITDEVTDDAKVSTSIGADGVADKRRAERLSKREAA